MNALVCMLALMSPHQKPEMVGRVVSKFEVYRTDRTEHCFEEVKKLGWTWIEDETLWLREVQMEDCQ